jgi:hypothetical protein
MFDLILSAFQAYNQIGMLVASAICLGIGGLLLGNSLYWRLRAHRVTGTIIGVMPERGMYAAVYRYSLPDGRVCEAKSDIATGWLGSYATGRVVRLMVPASDPSKARKATGVILDIVGLVCLIPGFLFGYTAVTAYPVTTMTWLLAAALAGHLAYRAFLVLRRGEPTASLAAWRKKVGLGEAQPLDLNSVKTAEEIQAGAEFRQEWTSQVRQSKFARVVIGVFALALFGVGVSQGLRIARLEASGLRADGQVIALREEYSSGDDGSDYVYYPVVLYRAASGQTVEFKDNSGSNPPSHRVGDRVTVLYLADNPVGEAIIDAGLLWNAALPAILLIAAVFLSALWFLMRRAVRPELPLPLGGNVKSAALP